MCPITGLAVNQVVQFKLTQRHVNLNVCLQEQNNSFPPLRANENGINNIDDVEYFLKLSGDKLPVLNDGRLKFIFSNDSYDICCVYVTMAPHYLDFDFKLTSDAKIQPVF